jgi:hypothetical protein
MRSKPHRPSKATESDSLTVLTGAVSVEEVPIYSLDVLSSSR